MSDDALAQALEDTLEHIPRIERFVAALDEARSSMMTARDSAASGSPVNLLRRAP